MVFGLLGFLALLGNHSSPALLLGGTVDWPKWLWNFWPIELVVSVLLVWAAFYTIATTKVATASPIWKQGWMLARVVGFFLGWMVAMSGGWANGLEVAILVMAGLTILGVLFGGLKGLAEDLARRWERRQANRPPGAPKVKRERTPGQSAWATTWIVRQPRAASRWFDNWLSARDIPEPAPAPPAEEDGSVQE
ncbi:MAG TPA: hypothetical protein VLF91_02440 [Candidatus Saccharimonadales bacterium]|nr:hypothetical protein [Candidatus Saccharimonadales bacterium]